VPPHTAHSMRGRQGLGVALCAWPDALLLLLLSLLLHVTGAHLRHRRASWGASLNALPWLSAVSQQARTLRPHRPCLTHCCLCLLRCHCHIISTTINSCDGSEPQRKYYDKLARLMPLNTMVRWMRWCLCVLIQLHGARVRRHACLLACAAALF
jgi:hypothetical protein